MPDRYVWTAADGSTVELSDQSAGYTVIRDATADLRSPTYNFATQEYAGIDGVEVQAIKALPATPTLGLYIKAAGPQDLRAKLRGLIHAMRPKAGIGSLTASIEDGSSRTLACYLQGGLEGDDSNRYPTWYKTALKFYAPDPWWLGGVQTISVGLSAGVPFFPTPPVSLAPSSVQGQFVLDLSGSDAPAYPIWTITGPGSSIVLTNVTTGASLSLDVSLVLGQSLTIDTHPRVRSVRRNDGVSLMPQVTPGTDPSLWSLVEGLNTVSVSMTGATADSRITGTYQARYAGI